jgi:6-phosphogluconolactonase (cycloisomerase 2 family)
MKRQLIMAVTILLIVNLLIPNATSVYPKNQFPISSDGSERFARSLYVSNSGEDNDPRGQGSTIARFTSDAAGRLTLAEMMPACGGANRLVFTPDLRFAYLACIYAGQIAAYRVAEDGALTSIGQVGFPDAFGIAIAPNGHTLYVSSAEDSTLAAFRVGADGQLTPLNSVDSGGSTVTRGLAVTPDGRFVYVGHGAPLGAGDNVLTGFALGADGSLQGQVAEAPNGASGVDMVITPDGRFLYVAAGGSNRVFGYEISADGSLAAVPGQSFPSGDFSIGAAMSPDGRRIFVAALGTVVRGSPGEVTGWAIGADGSLTEIERLETAGDALGIQFAPDGRHLYVGDFFFDKVTGFRVSAGGKLTEIQTVDSGGPDPHRITILPNRGPLASFSAYPEPVGRLTRFDASASSDSDGQVARYDWDFGDGTILQNGGPMPRHVYHASGTYQVRLTAVDNEGCSISLVFTGQVASCLGSPAATTTRTITVGR